MTFRVYRLAHELALERNPIPFRPARTSNRWNDDSVVVAYASDSVALAAMEMLTYWGRYASLRGYQLYAYSLDEGEILEQEADDPSIDPFDRERAQAYGTRWAEAMRSLALRVPSVVVPMSSNYLLNPNHRAFEDDKVEELGPFEFDPRILELIEKARQGGP